MKFTETNASSDVIHPVRITSNQQEIIGSEHQWKSKVHTCIQAIGLAPNDRY